MAGWNTKWPVAALALQGFMFTDLRAALAERQPFASFTLPAEIASGGFPLGRVGEFQNTTLVSMGAMSPTSVVGGWFHEPGESFSHIGTDAELIAAGYEWTPEGIPGVPPYPVWPQYAWPPQILHKQMFNIPRNLINLQKNFGFPGELGDWLDGDERTNYLDILIGNEGAAWPTLKNSNYSALSETGTPHCGSYALALGVASRHNITPWLITPPTNRHELITSMISRSAFAFNAVPAGVAITRAWIFVGANSAMNVAAQGDFKFAVHGPDGTKYGDTKHSTAFDLTAPDCPFGDGWYVEVPDADATIPRGSAWSGLELRLEDWNTVPDDTAFPATASDHIDGFTDRPLLGLILQFDFEYHD